jgi:hypothetical protein
MFQRLKAAAMSAGKDALTGVKAATKTAVGESRLALQAGLKDAKKSLTDNAAKFTQVGKQTFDNAAKKVGTLVNSYGALNNLGMANTSSTPVQGSSKPVQGSPKPVQGSSQPVQGSPKPVQGSSNPNDSVLPNQGGKGKKCKSCSRKSVKRTTKKFNKKFNKKSAKKSTKKSTKKSAKK